jgi:hypothetical protein
MAGERRKHRRVKGREVKGHLRVHDEVVQLGLPIENISMGGLFVRCDEPLPVGTPVVMELVRQGAALKVMGTTVAAFPPGSKGPTGPGMAIRFEPLPLDAGKQLSRLLVDLASEQGARVLPPRSSPSELGEEVVASRSAFDFGFVTLDDGADPLAGAWPAASPAAPAPQSSPTPPAAPGPASAAPLPVAASSSVQPAQSARLMVQVTGLLHDLGETRSELERRSREIAALREEVHRLKVDLGRSSAEAARKDARIAELESRLARGGPDRPRT